MNEEKSLKSLADKEVLCSSERLFLRKISKEDIDKGYLKWMNDDEVLSLTGSRGKKYSKEDLSSYIDIHNNDKDFVFLAIVIKDDLRYIGNIKIGPIDRETNIGDLGIIIGEKNIWGKGFGAEAIRLFVSYIFKTQNLNKISAGFFSGNEASKKAFLKSGFTITGSSQKHLDPDNSDVNVTWMEILNS
jgi:[ribosomal protein S5]-alanine N-acetyltransferase